MTTMTSQPPQRTAEQIEEAIDLLTFYGSVCKAKGESYQDMAVAAACLEWVIARDPGSSRFGSLLDSMANLAKEFVQAVQS